MPRKLVLCPKNKIIIAVEFSGSTAVRYDHFVVQKRFFFFGFFFAYTIKKRKYYFAVDLELKRDIHKSSFHEIHEWNAQKTNV